MPISFQGLEAKIVTVNSLSKAVRLIIIGCHLDQAHDEDVRTLHGVVDKIVESADDAHSLYEDLFELYAPDDERPVAFKSSEPASG